MLHKVRLTNVMCFADFVLNGSRILGNSLRVVNATDSAIISIVITISKQVISEFMERTI